MANFSFDGRIFDDLTQKVAELGTLFGSAYPQKSKDRLVDLMIKESKLQSFLSCHNSLHDLFVSMNEESTLSPTEPNYQQNFAAETLTKLFKAGILTKEQVDALAEQFDSAMILSYDICWLEKPEEREVFEQRIARIARYYYTMNTFIGFLTQRVTVTQGAKNASA